MSTLKQRLESKLQPGPGGCLNFTGGRNTAGYGNIYTHSVGRRTFTTMAHRAAWTLAHGEIPDGMQVLHRCDNPSCCNPAHLFIGTQGDNMQDKSAKGRALPGPSSRPEWWTPERKETRRRLTAGRLAAGRAATAIAAGCPPDWKLCPTCLRWLPPTSYNKNAARFDGLQAHCKPCKSEADIVRVRRNTGRDSLPRRATRSDKKHF